MPELLSNEAKLYYDVRGEGFPIIFTHGASWNHLQWKKQVEFFKDKFKVITWDVRGHGYSTLPDGPVNSEDFSSDLIALMDHLKLDKAILSLCNFPYRCEYSHNEILRYKGYRRLVIHKYVVLYSVDEENKTVIVMRVFYGAMDYEKYV
jgi:plasmid stabilization system protein ParE